MERWLAELIFRANQSACDPWNRSPGFSCFRASVERIYPFNILATRWAIASSFSACQTSRSTKSFNGGLFVIWFSIYDDLGSRSAFSIFYFRVSISHFLFSSFYLHTPATVKPSTSSEGDARALRNSRSEPIIEI